MTVLYKIKDWNKTFENADTRKRVRLGWFLCPAGNDSAGYVELVAHGEAGIRAFGVFIAICQWSATCLPLVRGSCARSDGRPLTTRQIASLVRMDFKVVSESLDLLCSEEIGWMTCENVENSQEKRESATNLPLACQSSASLLPQGEGEGEGEGEGFLSAKGGRKYDERFEEFWSVFPKQRRTKKQEAYRKWKLITKSVDAAWLTSRAAEYASSPKGQSEYAVMPSVWLNSGMYEDEREAWGDKQEPQSRVFTDYDNYSATGGSFA